MAIGRDNFSVEGVEQILQSGNNALMALNANNNDNNILLAIERIKGKIEFLREQENKVLSLFPAPNDRDSIRNKMAAYKATIFPDFFGSNLRNTFIEEFLNSAKSVKDITNQEQKQLAQYIVTQLRQNLSTDVKSTEIAKTIAEQFNGVLMTVTVTEHGSKTTSTKKTDMIGKNGDEILVDKLTPAMRSRLTDILNHLNGTYEGNRQFKGLSEVDLTQFQQQKNQTQIKVSSEWFNLTQGLTHNEIKKLVKDDEVKWLPVVQKANDNIIKMLLQHVSSSGKKAFEEEIKQKIDEDKYFFFVGKAATEITGLLGEITTIVAIKELTGKTVTTDWVANNRNEGKKVSIDVVLNKCLGINIKNTTENFSQRGGFHNVSFVDRNPKDIFDKLFDSGDNEALSNAFQTSYFNKSYQIKENSPHVVAGSNSLFNPIMVGLLDFRQKLIDYLYQFAPELMFMATDDLEKQLLILDDQLQKQISGAGNILYMVGGVPFFPSEMLTDLLADLEHLEQQLLQGKSKYHKSFFLDISKGNSDTIIDALNAEAEAGRSVALSQVDSTPYGTTIQLKTSWMF